MKRILLYLLLTALLAALASCGTTPNMKTLLAYQTSDAVFSVRVTDGGTAFDAEIALGDPLTLTLTCAPETDGVRFLASGGERKIAFGETSLSLPDGRVRADTWLSLFSLSENGRWKIIKERVGSLSCYVCTCDGTTIWIDAGTRLPLRLQNGTATIDVVFCDMRK